MKNKHGGKREGAKRPPIYGEAMERTEVYLPKEAKVFYRKLGKGNLSEGIRLAWRSLTQHALDGGDSAASEQFPTPEVLSTLQGESTSAHRK